jgi:phosphoglycolate phosphatase-like HAD superfamily hydrolase
MRLILFDIDGTLIDSGGAGVRSLDLALKELFSVENGFYGISMAGKTDAQIIKEGLTKYGISTDGNVESVISVYLKHLRNEINNDRKRVMPGIYEILENLSLKGDSGLGLLTGNLEQGARVKLEPSDSNTFLQGHSGAMTRIAQSRLLQE